MYFNNVKLHHFDSSRFIVPIANNLAPTFRTISCSTKQIQKIGKQKSIGNWVKQGWMMAMFGVWRELLIRGKVYLFGRLRNNLFHWGKRAPEKWIKDSLTFLWRNRQNLLQVKRISFVPARTRHFSWERCCCLIKRIKWALWGKKFMRLRNRIQSYKVLGEIWLKKRVENFALAEIHQNEN